MIRFGSLPVRSLRRVLRAAAISATAICASQALAADDSPSLPARQFAAGGIETVPVRAASSDRISNLPAHVQVPNAQQRFVATPIGGLVTEVRVGVGDAVKEGQPLARVVSAELLALQRDLAQAGAERERSHRALARDERLLAEGLVAESRVEASRAADRQAQAALAEKRSLLALSGVRPLSTGNFEIVAPIAGVVLTQDVHPGQRIDAATTLFRIARLDPLELQIDVPIAAASRVALGAAVHVPQAGAAGRVIAVGRAVGDAQTVLVRARLDSGTTTLGPGQHVEAEIDAGESTTSGVRRWAVPAAALVRLGAGGSAPAVFVLRGENYVAVPAVPLGELGGDIVVQAALSDGEPVVARGASQLKAALGAAAPGSAAK
ncbi:MAG: efflux RND transporter periplasmic adaptor subunit [Burkholderiaceae bacterium]|nr:efflux RND transporter periplasmic adaptor subunit [Burkholderiaceae bacterium]